MTLAELFVQSPPPWHRVDNQPGAGTIRDANDRDVFYGVDRDVSIMLVLVEAAEKGTGR